ncbi:MAG: hypothetical protein KAW41_04495 [Candidatus Diapherotrites archaeon]|nr:hypothetical protein [Candidatus Diapherotrites archaeon]
MASRGQEEAPFSLLLAVAMMALVIPIAAYMFQGFQAWECQQRIENNMETFARELELAATLGGGKRVVDIDLSLYACPGVHVDNFTLKNPGQDRCQEVCHDPNCRILEAVYEEFDDETGESLGLSVASQPVCVRIPVNVDFSTLDCDPSEGYEPLAGEGLAPGYYRIALIKEGYRVRVCRVPVERFG